MSHNEFINKGRREQSFGKFTDIEADLELPEDFKKPKTYMELMEEEVRGDVPETIGILFCISISMLILYMITSIIG